MFVLKYDTRPQNLDCNDMFRNRFTRADTNKALQFIEQAEANYE